MKIERIKCFKIVVLIASMAVLYSRMVLATPQLGLDNFDNGIANGWESYAVTVPSGSVGPADVHAVVNESGNSYYKLYFSPAGGPAEQFGSIYNQSVNYQGDYSEKSVTFDFWSSPAPPNVGLSFYFIGNGVQWNHSFYVTASQWTTVTMNFGSGWTGGTDFMGDLSNVSLIGIEINHITDGNGYEFTYGLDNWTVNVPEPESVALALVAVISLLLTFRQPILAVVRRRRE